MKEVSIEYVIQQREDLRIREQAILYKGEVYTWFDSGLTRHVFANREKTKVIKFLVREGSAYNEEEAEIWENAQDRSELAETKISNGIIEQEFCNPIKMDERKLTIAQRLFANQCRGEVGWTVDGRLVCFDLDEYKRY